MLCNVITLYYMIDETNIASVNILLREKYYIVTEIKAKYIKHNEATLGHL